MKHQCIKCGHDRLTFNFLSDDAFAACKRPGCGHRHPIKPHRENHIPIIPAGMDCQFTNQCRAALAGDCYRPHAMGEPFECVMARLYEREAA